MTRSFKRNSIYGLLLALISCGPQEGQEEFFFGVFYEAAASPSEYQVRKFKNNGQYRNTEIFTYDKVLKLSDQANEMFLVTAKDLQKVSKNKVAKPYLTIENSDCVEYSYDNDQINDALGTRICFLGKEDVLIGDKTYKDAYKFKKIKGELDGVESVLYYDTKFVLIKEEYVSGYTVEYKILRLDSALSL